MYHLCVTLMSLSDGQQVAEETATGTAAPNMGERERSVLAKYGQEEQGVEQDAAAAAADLDEDL